MNPTVEELITQVQKLPPQEQAALLEVLQQTLQEPIDPDIQAAWDAEIERRLAADDRGETTYVPWEQARKRLGLE